MTAVNIFSLGNDLVGNVSEYTEHMVIWLADDLGGSTTEMHPTPVWEDV